MLPVQSFSGKLINAESEVRCKSNDVVVYLISTLEILYPQPLPLQRYQKCHQQSLEHTES